MRCRGGPTRRDRTRRAGDPHTAHAQSRTEEREGLRGRGLCVSACAPARETRGAAVLSSESVVAFRVVLPEAFSYRQQMSMF